MSVVLKQIDLSCLWYLANLSKQNYYRLQHAKSTLHEMYIMCKNPRRCIIIHKTNIALTIHIQCITQVAAVIEVMIYVETLEKGLSLLHESFCIWRSEEYVSFFCFCIILLLRKTSHRSSFVPVSSCVMHKHMHKQICSRVYLRVAYCSIHSRSFI